MELMKDELNKIVSTYPCLSDLLEFNPNRIYYPFDNLEIKGLSLFWKILYYAPSYPILFEFLYNNIQNFTKEEINEEIGSSIVPLSMCLSYSKTKYNPKIIKTLLKNGADDPNPKVKNTYLRLVINNVPKNADHEILSILIEYGCDLNIIEDNGKTLLYNLTKTPYPCIDKKILFMINLLVKNGALLTHEENESFITITKDNIIHIVLQNMQDCDKNIKFCNFLNLFLKNFFNESSMYTEILKRIKKNYNEYKTPCVYLNIVIDKYV